MKLVKLTLLSIFMIIHAVFTVYGYVRGIQAIKCSGQVSYILMMLLGSAVLIACLLYLIVKFEM